MNLIKVFYILIFIINLFSNIDSYAQSRFNMWNDSINLKPIENCLGYKIVKQRISSLHGIQDRFRRPKYLTQLYISFDDVGNIIELKFLYNRNPTISLDKFEKCLKDNVSRLKEKVKLKELKLSLIFDESIQKDNDFYLFNESIQNVKNYTIQNYIAKRKFQSLGYDFNKIEVKFLSCSDNLADKIITSLDKESNSLIEKYKNKYKLCETDSERNELTNNVKKYLEYEIRNKYLEILNEYFKEE